MLIKICKAKLVAIIAAFFTLVAFSNITDYQTNFVFVEHVLKMDTIFPTSQTTWRAINSPFIHTLFYWFIIAWESITAIICWIAVIKLFSARHDTARFIQAKGIAMLGLTIGFTLYAFGFIVVGGEWFEMWQSAHWNGQPTAGLFMTMIGLVALILLSSDG